MVIVVGGVRAADDTEQQVQILDPDGTLQGELGATGIGTLSGVRGRWDAPGVFYSFVSFMKPTTIYRYDASTKERTIWAKESVPVASENRNVSVKAVLMFCRERSCFWTR